jgi:hypothetical protein
MTSADHPARLFRYTLPVYAEQMIQEGAVSLAFADLYRQEELLAAQRDDERSRVYKPEAAKLRLMTVGKDQPPRQLQGISDFRMSYQLPGYHVLCLSEEATADMKTAFPGQQCIEIQNPTEFFERLDKAIAKQIPVYRFYTAPVMYIPQQGFPLKLNNLELIYTKFDQFSYQHEYRVVLFTEEKTPPVPRYTFKLGCLSDICRILD